MDKQPLIKGLNSRLYRKLSTIEKFEDKLDLLMKKNTTEDDKFKKNIAFGLGQILKTNKETIKK